MNMVKIENGVFLMGTDYQHGFSEDGEVPIHEVRVDCFFIDAYPVTNDEFASFIRRTGYLTEMERLGWPFVFQNHIPEERQCEVVLARAPEASWWCAVRGASWLHPEGPDSATGRACL